MKKLIISLSVALLCTTTSILAQTKTAQGLIIQTTSKEESDKIIKSLKNADPSTYRLTVTTVKDGKKTTKVLGTAPISSIKKVGGATRVGGDVSETSDIIVLVKVITKGKELQDQLIAQLDRSLAKLTVKQVTLSRQNAILRAD